MKEIGIFEYLKAGFCEVVVWYESGKRTTYTGPNLQEIFNKKLPWTVYNALVKKEFIPYKTREGAAVKGTWYWKP